MQWLTLGPEHAGARRLRTERPAGATTGQLDAVARYPCTYPAQLGDKQAARVSATGRERRCGERRQNDRRGQQLTGVFDTRSKRDRRCCQDRRRSAGEMTQTPAGGIDVYA